MFVNDTPAEGAQIVVKAGDSLDINLYATNVMYPSATWVTVVTYSGVNGSASAKLWKNSKAKIDDCQFRDKKIRTHKRLRMNEF